MFKHFSAEVKEHHYLTIVLTNLNITKLNILNQLKNHSFSKESDCLNLLIDIKRGYIMSS